MTDGTLPPLMTWTTDDLIARYAEMEEAGFQRMWGGDPVADYNWVRPEGVPDNRFRFGAVTPAMFLTTPDMLSSDDPTVRGILEEERFAANAIAVVWNDDAERQACIRFIQSLPQRLTCGIGTDNPARDMIRLRRDGLPFNGVTNVGDDPWTTKAEMYKLFGPSTGNGATIGGSDTDLRRVWMSRVGIHMSLTALLR